MDDELYKTMKHLAIVAVIAGFAFGMSVGLVIGSRL